MESWEPTFHIPGALLFCSLRFGPDIRCVFAALRRQRQSVRAASKFLRRHKDKAIRWPIFREADEARSGAARMRTRTSGQASGRENPKTPYRTRSGGDSPDFRALIRRASYPVGYREEPEHVDESVASAALREKSLN